MEKRHFAETNTEKISIFSPPLLSLVHFFVAQVDDEKFNSCGLSKVDGRMMMMTMMMMIYSFYFRYIIA